jgi:hypothetical protein
MSKIEVYEVVYRTVDDVKEAHRRELNYGGGFVKSGEPPAALSCVTIRYHLPKGIPHIDVTAKVVNVQDGVGFFVQFAAGDEFEALVSAVEFVSLLEDSVIGLDDDVDVPEQSDVGAPDDGTTSAEPAVADRAPPLSGSIRPAWELVDLTSSVPLSRQVSELTIPEKTRLARHANRPVRALLIRDQEKRIHIEIVRNPKVRHEELIEWSAMPVVSPEALRWIASEKRISRIPQVQFNLVKNPATPRDVALKFLNLMPLGDLRKVIRMASVREAIVRAARRRLMTEEERK